MYQKFILQHDGMSKMVSEDNNLIRPFGYYINGKAFGGLPGMKIWKISRKMVNKVALVNAYQRQLCYIFQ